MQTVFFITFPSRHFSPREKHPKHVLFLNMSYENGLKIFRVAKKKAQEIFVISPSHRQNLCFFTFCSKIVFISKSCRSPPTYIFPLIFAPFFSIFCLFFYFLLIFKQARGREEAKKKIIQGDKIPLDKCTQMGYNKIVRFAGIV